MSTSNPEFKNYFPSITAHIDDSSVDALIEIAEETSYAPGSIVVQDDSPNDKLFFILDGSLDSYIEKDGDKIELGTLKSGDIAGEISMFGDCPTTATVVARTDCKLLSISKSDLNRLKATAPSFVNQLLRDISHTMAIRLLDADRLLYRRFTEDEQHLAESHGISSLVSWCTSMYQQMHGHKEV